MLTTRPSPADAAVQELVVDAADRQGGIPLGDLWRYRELLYFLAGRDIKVRYKQTVIGVAWALLQPLAAMVIFSIFFGAFAGLDGRTPGVPYPLYVLSGMVLWTFFATAVSSSASSLVANSNLITKVYFPRLIIPLSAVAAALADLAISSALVVLLAAVFQTWPGWRVLLLPVVLVGAILTATGVGSGLAALTVTYRDFQYAVPFLIQMWFFLTPVIYPLEIVPERWRVLLAINPMTGLVTSFRAALTGSPFSTTTLAVSLASALILFMAGAALFHRVERGFADVI